MPCSAPLCQFGAVKICCVASCRISAMMTDGFRELNLNSLCTQQFEFTQIDGLFRNAIFIRDLFPRNKSTAKSERIALTPIVGIKKPLRVGSFRYNDYYSVVYV